MSRTEMETICLDASVFISWLDDTPERMSAIGFLIDRIESRKVGIVASALVRTEVLPSKRPVEAYQKFTDFLKRKDQIEEVAVDRIIAEAAGEIRDKTSIDTPDAIHLATAIVHRAQAFYTYDGKLIKWSGKSEVKNLTICKPSLPRQGKSSLK